MQYSTQGILDYKFESKAIAGGSSEVRPALQDLYTVRSYAELTKATDLSDKDNALMPLSDAVMLPFSFPYYEYTQYQQLRVSTNGFVVFDSFDGSLGTSEGGET